MADPSPRVLNSSSVPNGHDRPWQIYRRLMSMVLERPVRVVVAMTALGISSLAMLAIPLLAGKVFVEAALQHDMRGVERSLILVLIAAAIMATARFLAEDQIGYVSLRLVEKIRLALVKKLMRLPPSYHARLKTGESVARTSNDVVMLQTFTYDSMFSIGSDILQVVGSAIFLVNINWSLTLILLCMVPAAALAIGVSSKWVRRRVAHLQSKQAEMMGLLTEQLVALPAVQAFDAADHEVARFGRSASVYTREGRSAVRISAGTRGLVNFLGVVAIVIVLVCGLQGLDLNQPAELEGLVKFALFSAMIADPLTRITRTVFEIQRALAAGRRVFEIIDWPIDVRNDYRSLFKPVHGEVVYQNIHFAYRPEEPILSEISLRIAPKENIGIVGGSGSGKSTLASLLMRFYEPTVGQVLVDGIDVKELQLSDLRSHIGWMGQDPFLISGTVADNIRYGNRSATMADIEAAAHMVAADEFIRDLPGKYEAIVGERGVDLSGGQRARIAMARVVIRSPEIVIFDESTAALDTDTEMILWRRLKQWLSERTAIVIAHRLVTILEIPRILVVEDGRIVGDGSVSELDRTCPAFRRLFAEQMNLMPRAA